MNPELAGIAERIVRQLMKVYQVNLPDDFVIALSTALSEGIPLAFEDLIDEEVTKAASQGMKHGFAAAFGREKGEALLVALLNRAEVPNTKLFPGQTRASFSKSLCRIRRNLGMPVERPQMARAGRKPKTKGSLS